MQPNPLARWELRIGKYRIFYDVSEASEMVKVKAIGYKEHKRMQISPNELFSLAIEDYIQRSRKQNLLQSINEAYADGLDDSEQAMLEGMRRHQRQLADRDL